MKTNGSKLTTMKAMRTSRRLTLLVSAALSMLASMPSPARADDRYRQVNLVSDLPGHALL